MGRHQVVRLARYLRGLSWCTRGDATSGVVYSGGMFGPAGNIAIQAREIIVARQRIAALIARVWQARLRRVGGHSPRSLAVGGRGERLWPRLQHNQAPRGTRCLSKCPGSDFESPLLRQAHRDCGDRLGPVRHGGHSIQNLAVAEVQQLNRLRGHAAARVCLGTIVVEHQVVERRKYRA